MVTLKTSTSNLFRGLQSKDIGPQDDGSVDELVGFRIGTILPNFRMLGIVFCWRERLKMLKFGTVFSINRLKFSCKRARLRIRYSTN